MQYHVFYQCLWILAKLISIILIQYGDYSNIKNCTEYKCGLILEAFTGHKFSSVRPDWLKNPITNKNLELDKFCDELSLGLEYQGQQHYEIGKFNDTKDKLEYQVYKDILKRKLCALNEVTLIIVPYTVRKYHLVTYIHKALLEAQSRTGIQYIQW